MTDPNLAPEVAAKMHNVPVKPRFALMLAFAEPLSSVIENSIMHGILLKLSMLDCFVQFSEALFQTPPSTPFSVENFNWIALLSKEFEPYNVDTHERVHNKKF